ncbi:zinc finger CCCH domain-containing protein 22-like isoform X2 [Rhododendron vialii]|uniref:zinc finger CCCH domain-containing protein 22-like isoform X2 n=1 Tax=Rhododendron vialii TaxID=182163 RepID=UPI00265FF04C|nr:zinc finger CCCH domain-containing protein 22-like isoform X2 [Rhododendron vialii]
MDSSEATKTVFSRIQTLDPENASKIMGFIFIQDPGEKEMIRLACGPETLLLSLINQAKSHLGLSSNISSAPPTRPRIIIPNNNGFHINPSSSSSPSPSSPWSVSGFNSPSPRPSPSSSLSYAAVVNGSTTNNPLPISSSLSLPVLYNHDQQQNLSFLDDAASKSLDFMDPVMSPSGRSDSMLLPYGTNNNNAPHGHFHRRSYSVNDEFLSGGFEEGGGGLVGGGWRPCMYFARGFCKNGDSCKFLHGGFGGEFINDAAPIGGGGSCSPGKIDGFDELLRMKAIQQQRYAAAASQLMAGGGGAFPYKGMNFDSPRSAAAALMIGEEFHKFGRCRPERNDFLAMGFGGNGNSSSRQIYLTFPADSTFKEEDVSNYFSKFGPVQDVRIPYQQKRMFGFVTFVYPETVKMILAKGNPHFVCDSRVLVKPYKEKGKVPERKHQQYPLDRGEFSSCLSPPGLDSGEQPFDHIGATMLYNTKEMILRRKMEEQAELQQAIELQGRRLMHLQLMDLRNHHHNLSHQLQPNMASGIPIPSPPQSRLDINQSLVLRSDGVNQDVSEVAEKNSSPAAANSLTVATDHQQEVKEACDDVNGLESSDSNGLDNDDFHESLEHILPDNLFASPTKSAGDHSSIFSTGLPDADDNSSVITTTTTSSNTIPMLPSTSTLTMASLKSCYFQMPSH